MFQIRTKPKKWLIQGGLTLFFCLFASSAFAADTTPPTGSIKINNGAVYTTTTSVTLNLSATDAESGVAQMKFSNNNSTWSTPQSYSTTKSWSLTSGNGTKTVYVKFKDKAGNWSGAYSDSIILDSTKPTGSIKINNGASSTNTINVTLNLSATDTGSGVSQMKFSNNNSTWTTAEPYATTKAWTLASGSGSKKAYVQYKDNAGNWSSAYSDSINLPNQTPQVGTITPSSGASNPQETVTFTTTYSDSNGWQDIKEARLLINAAANGANCFYVYYDQNNHKLYLRNDANSSWLGGYAPNSTKIIENSYAKLDCSKTTISGDNITLIVKWTVAFKAAFLGAKNTYLSVKDDANAYVNWTQKGTWTITQKLSISVNPKLWNIGSVMVNSTVTLSPANKITVANDGGGLETFELKLINPAGWQAASSAGKESYVLSGLFCNSNDTPQAGDFNGEDTITTESQKATSAIFGYAQGTANGVAVPANQTRSLYLQFKSPTITQKQEEQDISIIVSCSTP